VLFETPEARKLLNRIDNLATSSSTRSRDDPAVSQTEEHPSAAGMKHRHAAPKTNGNGNGTAGGMGGDKREYTTEQVAVVKRVKSCKATAYYDVLLVKKDCDEAEIKKAYRKVSYEIAMFSLIIYFVSLPWLCTLIKMGLRERTKRSNVSRALSLPIRLLLMFS
jgi:hypothetical protein